MKPPRDQIELRPGEERWDVHPFQLRSHRPGERPNHLVGLSSKVVSRGASIVSRKEANDESW
jgi:hypothetical protein